MDSDSSVSVEYQTLQHMYPTLQSGIQAGRLSDVANEAFSRDLIPPLVKRAACNQSTSEPKRFEVLLDYVMHKTRTYTGTLYFDDFVDLLAPLCSPLAYEMRRQRKKLVEERRRKCQAEVMQQMHGLKYY